MAVQYQLKMVHEHDMDRTSCNMCFGPFGGVKGICILISMHSKTLW